jgi:hypothetical protein
MTAPTKVNLRIYQGSTFEEVFRWESYTKVYKPITNITKTAPIVVTAASHGMPVGWRCKITDVSGMKEINSATTYHTVTSVDTNNLTINKVNAVAYSDYISGGIVEYNEPKSLAGLTARMQIRAKVTSTDDLLELTTENGMIIINDVNKTITITIPAVTTELLTFKSAVYSLELVDGLVVTPFIYGNITLDTEITR